MVFNCTIKNINISPKLKQLLKLFLAFAIHVFLAYILIEVLD